jgi:hypothetical protein
VAAVPGCHPHAFSPTGVYETVVWPRPFGAYHSLRGKAERTAIGMAFVIALSILFYRRLRSCSTSSARVYLAGDQSPPPRSCRLTLKAA